jgi:hypothetical protein
MGLPGSRSGLRIALTLAEVAAALRGYVGADVRNLRASLPPVAV